MSRIRDLQRALELAHYAARNRGSVHVVVPGGTVGIAELQLDLRLLSAYGMRTLVVAHWHGGAARDLVAQARRQGFPLQLVDGDDELDSVAEAVRQALAAGRMPVVLVPDRARRDGLRPAESVALQLGVALSARRILFVTSDAAELLAGESRPHLNRAEARALAGRAPLEQAPRWAFILATLDAGVPGVVVLDGAPGALFEELFTHQGAGVLMGGEPTEGVRQATLVDAADISLLLRAEMERGVVRPVTEETLLATIDQHLVYTIDEVVVGTARLAPYGAWAELSRFATLPRYRGRGRARTLGLALIERGRTLGFTDLFALSVDERMWSFFESLGFVATSRETLPEAWRTAYDFTRPSRAFHRSCADAGEAERQTR